MVVEEKDPSHILLKPLVRPVTVRHVLSHTSGLTGIEWALTDVPAGSGGFRCIAGSHKANFDLPFEVLEDEAENIPVSAGDVVIFTEALTHGSRWLGPASRRVLIYKYCPGSIAWLSDVWDDDSRAVLTERQRQMTVPPFVFDSDRQHKRDAVLPPPQPKR